MTPFPLRRSTPARWWWAVVFPLLLFPVVMLVVGSMLDFSGGGASVPPLRMAIFSEDPAPHLFDFMNQQTNLELRTDLLPERFKTLVRDDSVDAALIVPAGYTANLRRQLPVELRLYQRDDDRRTDRVMDRLMEDFERHLVRQRLDSLGAPAGLLDPLQLDQTSVADPNGGIAGTVGTIGGLLFLLVLLGAILLPRPAAPFGRWWLAGIASVMVLTGILLGYFVLPTSELVRTSVAPLMEPAAWFGMLGALLVTGILIALIADIHARLGAWGRFLLNFVLWGAVLVALALFIGGTPSEGVPILGLLNAARKILSEQPVAWFDVIGRPLVLIGVGYWVFQKMRTPSAPANQELTSS